MKKKTSFSVYDTGDHLRSFEEMVAFLEEVLKTTAENSEDDRYWAWSRALAAAQRATARMMLRYRKSINE